MSRLESRKQLLLSESELNRALLLQQCKTVSIGFNGIASQANIFGAIASTAGAWIGDRFSSKTGIVKTSAPNSAMSVTVHVLRSTQLLLEIWDEIQSLRGK